MYLIKTYLQQTQKPDGLLGSLMISSMNRHHAKLADWGMSHLVNISPDTIEELGCGGGRNVKVLLRKYPDAKISALDYSPLSVRKTMQTNHRAIMAKRCTVVQGSVTKLRLYTIQCSAFSAPANLSNASSASQSSVSRSMLFSKQ